MNSKYPGRVLVALGTGVALVIGVTVASLAATAPRDLPADPSQSESEPQDQAPAAQDRERDRTQTQFDRRGDRRFNRDHGGNFMERRLDFLHERLRITPAQQRLWNAFADELRGEAEALRDRFADRLQDLRGQRGRGLPNVVDQLERRHETLTDRTARLERLLGVVRPLYTALDQNQKRIADRLLLRAERAFFDRGGGPGDGRFDFEGQQRRRGYN